MNRLIRSAVLVALLSCCIVSPVEAAENSARLMPPDAMMYGEYRSPKVIFDLVEAWFKGMGGPMANALDEPLGELAQELGMELKAFRAEAAKVKDVGIAITGFEFDKGFAGMVLTADMSDTAKLRDAIAAKIKELSEEPVATVAGVAIHGDGNETYACVAGDHAMLSTKLDLLKDAVGRLKGTHQGSLLESPRFRKYRAELDPKATAVSFMDAQILRRMMLDAQKENVEIAAVDAALDLKTVDCLISSLHVDGKTALAKYAVILSGENRTLNVFRTKSAARSVTKFYSGDYGLVTAGTLVDGKAQWQGFIDLMARVQAALGVERGDDDVLTEIGEFEETLQIKLADELGNVLEYAVGIKAGKEGMQGGPDVLFAFKVKDVNQANAMMQKIEKVAKAEMDGMEIKEEEIQGVKVRSIDDAEADSDYAYAFVGDTVLLSNHRAVVADALKCHAAGKCILDEKGAKKVLANLQVPNAKLILVNVTGFMPPDARNPHAPAPGMIGVTTVETDRRVDLVGDFSSFGDLIRLFFGMVMGGMGG